METGGFIWSKQLRTADGLTYRLYNYSKQTTYDRAWNDATMAARGLIVCEETGEIIAASMGKFFNLGESIVPGRSGLASRTARSTRSTRRDGSCGIQYRLDGKVRWATRGAFFSDQAQVAQALWDERYKQHDELLMTEWNHLTLCAEIIHRATRVVCIYPYEDLVLLSARNRFTGETISYSELLAIGARLGMRVVREFDFADAEAVLNIAKELDGNTEGFVLWLARRLSPQGQGREVQGGASQAHRYHCAQPGGSLVRRHDPCTGCGHPRGIPPGCRTSSAAARRRHGRAGALETEEIYATAAGIRDRKEYATWVKAQDKRLAGFLHARRARDEAGGVATVARGTLASAITTGHVYRLLSASGDDGLSVHLQAYQQAMAAYLWDKTRTLEVANKAKGIAPSLPKQLRSSWDSALVNLQPSPCPGAYARIRAQVHGHC